MDHIGYIGCKYSLINFIKSSIFNVVGDKKDLVFADLFAGTGVVGCAFKREGFQVIANDIQYYAYVLNRHFIMNVPPLNAEKYKNYLDDLPGQTGFIFNNYCSGSNSGRNYFTNNNGAKCDAIRMEIETLKNKGRINEDEYCFLLASLLTSVDKCANTASVYGAFLKHIKNSASRTFEFELLPIIDSNKKNIVYNQDANVLINNIEGDILYLDPPYNARQYCTNYHVLETIAKYDNPILKGKTGLREYGFQKSKYCSKRTVINEFQQLIKDAKFRYIFLSYNNEGLMSLSQIKVIMQQYGKYELFATNYKRFKADKETSRNYKSNKTTEYLHCLIKK